MLGFSLSNSLFSISAVTYSLSGGRFGDNLIAYSHAKWISYRHNIPLLYKPFEYSDALLLHKEEKKWSAQTARKYKKNIKLKHKDFSIDRKANILYEVPYFPESTLEPENRDYPVLFEVNWNDQNFLKIIRKLISPRHSLQSPLTPKRSIPIISVAVHVRKGTGIDSPELPKICPFKSPPDSYYIEQINKIAEIFHNKVIYVYIFTDHPNPLEIRDTFRQEVNKQNVIFACRETKNFHNVNVVEDFFALTKFDCLIRSDSNFSLMACKLVDYKIHIAPEHITNAEGNIVVDQVKITRK